MQLREGDNNKNVQTIINFNFQFIESNVQKLPPQGRMNEGGRGEVRGKCRKGEEE